MYEYKFEEIKLKGWINRKPIFDYHKMIQDYGRQGWRLVQVLAPPLKGYGEAAFFELIFEREIK